MGKPAANIHMKAMEIIDAARLLETLVVSEKWGSSSAVVRNMLELLVGIARELHAIDQTYSLAMLSDVQSCVNRAIGQLTQKAG